ncbi:MAG: GNAT family N-acetyltransferase [Candidatus Brocadiia bacterium]
MTTIIRPLHQADADDLAKNCFPDLPLDDVLDAVREDLALQEAGQGITLVAVEDGRVGVHVKLLKKDDSGWVFNVASHPDFRGRGIVQDVLAELARRARAMGTVRLLAHVRADNRRARRAYEKAGFRPVGQDGMRGEQLRYELNIFP